MPVILPGFCFPRLASLVPIPSVQKCILALCHLSRACYTHTDMSLNSSYYPAPRKRRRGLEVIFILGFIICLLLGLAALGALWYLRSEENATALVDDPFTLLAPEEVLLALATRDLAGDDTSALVRQALGAGEVETAAALLLHDTTSTGSARAALWQQIARAWRDVGDADSLARAVVADAQALHMGILDLSLHALERGQVLTNAAAGFAESAALGNGDARTYAITAATQAKRAIAQTPDLLPAQRAQLLQPLKTVVAQLNAPELLAEVDDLLRNPYLTPASATLKSTWSTLYTPPTSDAAIDAAKAQRELTARNLADRYALTNGIDVEPEVEALRQALIAEDAARTAWFQSAIAAATTQQQQLGLLLVQQDWQLRKLAIANRAYGLSLMPEWENAHQSLEAELNGLAANIETIVRAIADAQPTPLDQNLLRAEASMRSALASAMGRYPGADNNLISQTLRSAQDALLAAGTKVALPVLYEASATPPGFRIQAQ